MKWVWITLIACISAIEITDKIIVANLLSDKAIQYRIDNVQEQVSAVSEGTAYLRDDIDTLESDIAVLKMELERIKFEIVKKELKKREGK